MSLLSAIQSAVATIPSAAQTKGYDPRFYGAAHSISYTLDWDKDAYNAYVSILANAAPLKGSPTSANILRNPLGPIIDSLTIDAGFNGSTWNLLTRDEKLAFLWLRFGKFKNSSGTWYDNFFDDTEACTAFSIIEQQCWTRTGIGQPVWLVPGKSILGQLADGAPLIAATVGGFVASIANPAAIPAAIGNVIKQTDNLQTNQTNQAVAGVNSVINQAQNVHIPPIVQSIVQNTHSIAVTAPSNESLIDRIISWLTGRKLYA